MPVNQLPDARPALPAAISETGIVAGVRDSPSGRLSPVLEQLLTGGLRCVQIASTSPGAPRAIAAQVATFGADVCIGASAVRTAAEACECVAAGACFLTAPTAVPEVIAAATKLGVACLSGALTPSEIDAAWASGAAAVTVFPASLGGPRYLHAVRAPLHDIPLVPTGGVEIDEVPEYLSAGALAVGLDNALVTDALSGGDLAALAERVRRAVMAVRVAREGRPV